MLPYALWARRRLKRLGAWQPQRGRDVALSLLAVGPLVIGAQAVARLLTRTHAGWVTVVRRRTSGSISPNGRNRGRAAAHGKELIT